MTTAGPPFRFRRWEISADGVCLRSFRGRPLLMRWDEIERLRWNDIGFCIRGRGRSMRVHWQLVPREDREAVREFVRAKLIRDFDLSIPPMPAPRPLATALL